MFFFTWATSKNVLLWYRVTSHHADEELVGFFVGSDVHFHSLLILCVEEVVFGDDVVGGLAVVFVEDVEDGCGCLGHVLGAVFWEQVETNYLDISWSTFRCVRHSRIIIIIPSLILFG